MQIDSPLKLYKDVVREDWIDYNGHLNDGYYAVSFGIAVEDFLKHVDLHTDYLTQSSCTIYTVEAHISYLRELKVGTAIEVHCQVLGFDEKRIHLYQEMFNAEEGYLAATYEGMFLHINQDILKTVAMPEDRQATLAGILAEHDKLGVPERAGRAIGLKK